jgi:hypothetical protein
MTADDYSVTPPSPLSGAIPTRKGDNNLAGPRRQPGKRRQPRGSDRSSGASESAAGSSDPGGAKSIPPDDDGELHVDCFI